MDRLLIFFTLLSFTATGQNWQAAGFDKQPTIVTILTDDVSATDISAQKTPFINSMKVDGVYLPNAISAQVCAQARLELHYNSHSCRGISSSNTIQFVDENHLRENAQGLAPAEIARNAGYYTSLVGKWGLGSTMDENIQLNPLAVYMNFVGALGHSNPLTMEEIYINPVRIDVSIDGNIAPYKAGMKDSVMLDFFYERHFNIYKNYPEKPLWLVWCPVALHGPYRWWTDPSWDIGSTSTDEDDTGASVTWKVGFAPTINNALQILTDAHIYSTPRIEDAKAFYGGFLTDGGAICIKKTGNPSFETRTNAIFRLAASWELDDQVKRLVDSVRTVYGDDVIFCIGSDNGGSERHGSDLTGVYKSKSYSTTGGAKCPWIIWSPKIKNAQRVLPPRISDKIYCIGDIKTTMLKMISPDTVSQNDMSGWDVWFNWKHDTLNTRRKGFIIGGYNTNGVFVNTGLHVPEALNSYSYISNTGLGLFTEHNNKFGQATNSPTFEFTGITMFDWINDNPMANPLETLSLGNAPLVENAAFQTALNTRSTTFKNLYAQMKQHEADFCISPIIFARDCGDNVNVGVQRKKLPQWQYLGIFNRHLKKLTNPSCN